MDNFLSACRKIGVREVSEIVVLFIAFCSIFLLIQFTNEKCLFVKMINLALLLNTKCFTVKKKVIKHSGFTN